jgi:hypothetical protein
MCHQVKTIAKNCNGQLSFCEGCKVYHFMFNNIYIEFTKKELKAFQKHVNDIEVEYWEMKYDRMIIERKIPIGTMQQNLSMMFNRQELDSLKDLIFQKQNI